MSDRHKHTTEAQTHPKPKAKGSEPNNPKLPRRRRAPLAFGEYVPAGSGDNSDQTWMARRKLIDATAKVCPNLLDALANDVFPVYDQLAKSGFDFDQTFAGRSGTSPYKRLAADAKLTALKAALHKWAMRFNAESAEWLLDAALQTMRGWYIAPEWRRSLRWDLPFGRVITPIPAETFVCPGWEVQGLTFAEYRDLVNSRLGDYERKMRELAESHGLIQAQWKYAPRNFDWFALYQFAGMSSKEIAKGDPTHREDPSSTVLKGIKAVAKLVGWKHLRKPTQGNTGRKIQ